jgi:hypothetical protein
MMRHALLAVLACSVACGEASPTSKQPGTAGTTAMGGAGNAAGGIGNGGAMAGSSAGSAGAAGAAGASAGSGAGGAPVLGANESYEAEEAFDAGTATFVASTTDVSGTGYVDALGTPGAKLIFAVNAAADGPSAVRLRFRNTGEPKNVTIFVNGTNFATTTLSKSDSFVEHQQMLTLRAGLNTVSFVNAGSGATVSVDHLTLESGAPRPARGATVPFVEYEGEAGTVVGTSTSIGPDTLAGTLAANASGRRAVTLAVAGDGVEWTTTAPASGLTVRFALPDAPGGGGLTGTVALYVDGQKRQELPLSSKNAWVYDPYPFGNQPSGVASRLFSESRFTIGDVAAGAKVRLQHDTDSPPVTIDLIDLEQVPAAYAQPPGSVSITAHGATADDQTDDSAAFTAAIAAAKPTSQIIWIPPGHFTLGARVDLEHVTVRGAGPWHSVLHGKDNRGGFNGTGDQVQLLDFAFIGDQDHRDDSFDSAVDGKLGQNSLIFNLFIQSSKVGIWLIDTNGAYVVGSRISDTYADGVNLNTNVTHTAVEHSHIRNTGDDGMAIWSKGSSVQNRFKLNTVHVPYHASAIAVYGGDSHHVEDCDVADTVRNGAGIQVGTRHDPVPLAGATVIARNTLSRTSSLDVPNQGCFGALWLFADTKDMDAPLVLRDLTITESACNAIYFTGTYAVKQVQLEAITVQNAGGAGLKIETPGAGTFDGVSLTGAAEAASVPPAFMATKGAGNVGW